MDYDALKKEYDAMLGQRDRHKQQIEALQKVMFIQHAALKDIVEAAWENPRSYKVRAGLAIQKVREIVEIS